MKHCSYVKTMLFAICGVQNRYIYIYISVHVVMSCPWYIIFPQVHTRNALGPLDLDSRIHETNTKLFHSFHDVFPLYH
jgi:hypothetical protein